jgi:tetratricopeptide (TPR) repeat protein
MPRPHARSMTLTAFALLLPAAIAQSTPPEDADPDVDLREIRARIDALMDDGGGDAGGAEPEISPALRATLDAAFLTDDERRALRVEHGLWEPGGPADDLAAPTLRAEAALIAGVVLDPVFDDPGVPALLRAEALINRGDPGAALALLGDAPGGGDAPTEIRAASLRAKALFDLGRFEDADAAVQPAADLLAAEPIADARALAAGVDALILRTTLRGSTRAAGGDFRTLMRLIENGRDNVDRLSWRIRLTEARLLYQKHNRQDAAAAVSEILTLNPRASEALALLGRIAADNFGFADAERVAAELEAIAEQFDGPSALAAELRARVRLKQRDPDSAEEILAEIRGVFPTHRGLLALHAAAAAARFDDAAVNDRCDEFEALAPGSPLAKYEVGVTLAEARQYDTAADELGEAARALPNWSSPWIELGLVLIQAGRDREAERYLAEAVALDPFNSRAKNSLELVRGLKDFATLESDHFVVRYQPGIDELLATEMLPVLDRIHDRVTADPKEIPGGIGHEPRDKTLIELMPSHRWFSVRITGMTRVHTMAAATGPVIAMESPQEGPEFTVGHYDWPRVLQHEYVHTVTLSRTNNRIPHWFTEAAAVFAEDAPRDERTWRLLARAHETGTLFDLDKISIAFVRPEKPTDRGQAYAQGHWMLQFINERWGPEAPVMLMDRYARGETEASAFQAELGVAKDEFMELFLEWAEADLRRVGLVVPEDTPTVPEMLDADRREAEDPEAVTPDRAFVSRWREQYPEHPQLAELLVSIELSGIEDPDAPRLPGSAVEALSRLAELIPVAETPHRLLARHHLAGETPEASIPHLEFLDAREQNSPAYATELARLYADAGDFAAADRKAERAVRIAPFDADAREFAARVALKAALDGERAGFERAERHIAALARIEPGVELHQQRLERVRTLSSDAPGGG